MGHDSVSLDALALDPGRALTLSDHDRTRVLLTVSAILTALAAAPKSATEPGHVGDKLLTVKQAAVRLSMSTDYLYRHAAKFPFAVRDGRRLRFSERGIERWIATRQRLGRLSEST